jgi:hypothetical protein
MRDDRRGGEFSLFPPLVGEKEQRLCRRGKNRAEVLQRRPMLFLFLRVHSLVVELKTVAKSLQRNQDDEELAMMLVEIRSECSSVELDLTEEPTWSLKYLTGCAGASPIWTHSRRD